VAAEYSRTESADNKRQNDEEQRASLHLNLKT
jgi:hypothetical protein